MAERGQMIERSEGVWLLRVYLGTIEGKRRYANKTLHGTTSQAQKELTRMLGDSDKGTLATPNNATVKSFVSEWLDTKANVSVSTLIDYKHRMEKDVYPFIGGVKLRSLNEQIIRALYVKLRDDRKLSTRTIRYTHAILGQALQLAVDIKLLAKNPCRTKIVTEVIPKKRSEELVVLTPEQMTQLLDKAQELEDARFPLWRLMLTTGLRPQEALALVWDDLEVKGETTWLNVRRALHAVGKGKYTVADWTKTEGSKRSLVLDSETVAVLKKHRALQNVYAMKLGKKYERNGIMFAAKTGKHLDIANVRRWWDAACVAAGCPALRLYVGTRHTHASHMLDITGNAKAVAERLGHKDPAMTLRVYSHTLPGTQEAAVLAFSKRLETRQAKEKQA